MPTNKSVNCHSCGNSAVPISQETELKLGGRCVSVLDEFMRCTTCEMEFYLPGQMDATQRRAIAKARSEEGLLLPEEIVSIRQELGLSQADFEKLLGVGPKTVVRWEKGTVFQNAATDALLRLVRANRANAELLAAMHGLVLTPPVTPMTPTEGPSYKDVPLKARTGTGDINQFWRGGQPLVITVDLEDVSDMPMRGASE